MDRGEKEMEWAWWTFYTTGVARRPWRMYRALAREGHGAGNPLTPVAHRSIGEAALYVAYWRYVARLDGSRAERDAYLHLGIELALLSAVLWLYMLRLPHLALLLAGAAIYALFYAMYHFRESYYTGLFLKWLAQEEAQLHATARIEESGARCAQ